MDGSRQRVCVGLRETSRSSSHKSPVPRNLIALPIPQDRDRESQVIAIVDISFYMKGKKKEQERSLPATTGLRVGEHNLFFQIGYIPGMIDDAPSFRAAGQNPTLGPGSVSDRDGMAGPCPRPMGR